MAWLVLEMRIILANAAHCGASVSMFAESTVSHQRSPCCDVPTIGQLYL